MKPKVNYNPSDEVEAAIKGAKLRFVGETDEEEEESGDQGEGGNGGGNNPDDGMLG